MDLGDRKKCVSYLRRCNSGSKGRSVHDRRRLNGWTGMHLMAASYRPLNPKGNAAYLCRSIQLPEDTVLYLRARSKDASKSQEQGKVVT